MIMVTTVFCILDVTNQRVHNQVVVVTEDLDKAAEYIFQEWLRLGLIKPERGYHMMELTHRTENLLSNTAEGSLVTYG